MRYAVGRFVRDDNFEFSTAMDVIAQIRDKEQQELQQQELPQY